MQFQTEHLSHEEEQALTRRFSETKDPDAKAELVAAFLPLVASLAHKYTPAWEDVSDFINAGVIGLSEAVDHFDVERGTRLSTYVRHRIRGTILNHLQRSRCMVSLGTTTAGRKMVRGEYRARRKIEGAGLKATPEAMAKELGVSVRDAREMGDYLHKGESRDMGSLIDPNPNPEECFARKELCERVHEFGATLTGRNKELFERRLVAEEPVSQNSLAKEWGVCQQKVSRRESALKRRLKNKLEVSYAAA